MVSGSKVAVSGRAELAERSVPSGSHKLLWPPTKGHQEGEYARSWHQKGDG